MQYNETMFLILQLLFWAFVFFIALPAGLIILFCCADRKPAEKISYNPHYDDDSDSERPSFDSKSSPPLDYDVLFDENVSDEERLYHIELLREEDPELYEELELD